jgi:hypothetical protein
VRLRFFCLDTYRTCRWIFNQYTKEQVFNIAGSWMVHHSWDGLRGGRDGELLFWDEQRVSFPSIHDVAGVFHATDLHKTGSQAKPLLEALRTLNRPTTNSYIFSKHHKLQFHGHSDTCNTNIYSARGPSVIHFCSWNLVLCVDALHLHVVMPVALQKKGYVTSDAN